MKKRYTDTDKLAYYEKLLAFVKEDPKAYVAHMATFYEGKLNDLRNKQDWNQRVTGQVRQLSMEKSTIEEIVASTLKKLKTK